MEYILTSGQLATALAPTGVTVSAATIQRYAREGRIPSRLTLGGRYRYNLAEVQQALATPTAVGSLSRPRLTGGLGTGAPTTFSDAARLEAELRAHHSETHEVGPAVRGQRSVSAAVRDQVEHASARAVAFA